jgi:SAM-dependent methyltransferase
MKNMKEIISPLTLTNNVSFVRNIKSKNIISLYKNYDINVSRYFKGHKEISVYQCNETGYKFYYPYNVAGDSAFYQHFQGFDWYYMPWKWEHEITTKYLKDDMKVLEVGCAHGAFLEKINTMFKLKPSIGLELNESTPTENEKWKILNHYVQDYAKDHSEQFDIVCSYQVLEHIADVHSFIEANVVCLKKGGKLIISVPNNDSFIKNNNSALNRPPHHMGLWTKESLISLTNLFSLELINIHLEELKEYHVDSFIWSEKYSKGNKFVNKLRRKIHLLTGQYAKLKSGILGKRETLIGHTILAVYQKI